MLATFTKASTSLRTLTFYSSKRLFERRDGLLIFKIPKLFKKRRDNAEKVVASDISIELF